MTTAARRARRADSAAAAYFEPGRTYATSWALAGLLAAAFVGDVLLGGARQHLLGWVLVVVVVVGIDVISVRAARALRSVTVTADELRVGDAALPRDRIIGYGLVVDASTSVLGRLAGEGLPRGSTGLAVHLVDGTVVAVPTRHPDRLTRALELSLQVPDIRPATEADEAELPDICERAETLFRVSGIDLPPIPFPSDTMHDAVAVFVAGQPPVGFVRVDRIDGCAHIHRLAVVPPRMRQGLGSALLEAACTWAREQGLPAITVITFADVPWNAPFYAARGFVEVAAPSPGIAELRDWEHAMGLDGVGRRVVMRRELAPAG